MAITVNLRYLGKNGAARAFTEEMISSGTVDKIRAEEGNLRYEYYVSLETCIYVGKSNNILVRLLGGDGRVCQCVAACPIFCCNN